MTAFSDYIREQRLRAKLSQQELADRAGVTQGAVSQYETGTVVPRPGKVVAMARALGLSPDELLSRSGYYEPATEPSSRGDAVDDLLSRPGGDITGGVPGREARYPTGVAPLLAQLIRRMVARQWWPWVIEELREMLRVEPAVEAGTDAGKLSEQDWFWRDDWQEEERKAADDLVAGRAKRYSDAREMLASLN